MHRVQGQVLHVAQQLMLKHDGLAAAMQATNEQVKQQQVCTSVRVRVYMCVCASVFAISVLQLACLHGLFSCSGLPADMWKVLPGQPK